MDWPKDQTEIDAMERVAELERSFNDGSYRPMTGFLAGFHDFGTFGNADRVGAWRNALDPGGVLGRVLNYGTMGEAPRWPQTEDEVARVRQHDPLHYYGGQAASAAMTAIAAPPVAALLAGGAIYNNPIVQRTARDLYRDALQSIPGRSLAVLGVAPLALRDALRGDKPTDSAQASPSRVRNPQAVSSEWRW
jgi:hypothetical protein